MKKHVIATLAVLLVFTALLGGFLAFRSGEAQREGSAGENFVTERKIPKREERKESLSAETEPTEMESGANRQEGNADKRDFTMVFAGDVLFANSFQSCYEAGGIDAVVSKEILKTLTQADLTMVNEEFPFSVRGVPMEDKQYTFRADPVYVSALLEMGVDVVSLANNHILDYGGEALTDTFVTLDDAGIAYVGAGADKERAGEPFYAECGGRKFAFLAASLARWAKMDFSQILLATAGFCSRK